MLKNYVEYPFELNDKLLQAQGIVETWKEHMKMFGWDRDFHYSIQVSKYEKIW